MKFDQRLDGIPCTGCYTPLIKERKYAELMCDNCAIKNFLNGELWGIVEDKELRQELRTLRRQSQLAQIAPPHEQWRYSICDRCENIMNYSVTHHKFSDERRDIWEAQYTCKKCGHESKTNAAHHPAIVLAHAN